MKNRKVQIAAAGLAAAILFGGCGTEPYRLTEKEEAIIVNYSAHVVAKYNTYQKEGLANVVTGTEEPEAAPLNEPENAAGEPEGDAIAEQPAEEMPEGTEEAATATLTELFGMSGTSLEYVGARLSPSYKEDDYFAQDAAAGMTYLIVGIDIINPTDAAVELDYLSMAPEFWATVNGTETSTAEITVLSGDFASCQETLDAGKTKEAVLLFQVPDTVVSVDSLELLVKLNGSSYQINLEAV